MAELIPCCAVPCRAVPCRVMLCCAVLCCRPCQDLWVGQNCTGTHADQNAVWVFDAAVWLCGRGGILSGTCRVLFQFSSLQD
jgi:hypothetical protein